MKAIGLLSIGLVVLAGCSDAPDKPEVKQAAGAPPVAPAASERVAEATQVIAYYFHRTIRCETCLRIEKQAHEVITNRFAFEVAAERLVFKPVNYEQPENAHFREDYELGGPSLVLVRQKGGKDVERKVLGQTWDFAHIPPKLDLYIEEETRKFLEREKLPAGDGRVSTNSTTSGQGPETSKIQHRTPNFEPGHGGWQTRIIPIDTELAEGLERLCSEC